MSLCHPESDQDLHVADKSGQPDNEHSGINSSPLDGVPLVPKDRLIQALKVFRALNKLFQELTFTEKSIITPDKDIAEAFLSPGYKSGHQQDISGKLLCSVSVIDCANISHPLPIRFPQNK